MMLRLAVETKVGSFLVSRTKTLTEEVAEGRRTVSFESVKVRFL